MGRRARPVELYVLNGKHKRGKREIAARQQAEASVRPASAKLRPPKWLDKPARKEWRRVVRLMAGLGILTDADVNTLAVYCDAAVRYAEAAQRVREEGLIVTKPSGEPMQNPAALAAERYWRIMAKAAAALGLDPSARAALAKAKAQQQQKQDRFEEMFGTG